MSNTKAHSSAFCPTYIYGITCQINQLHIVCLQDHTQYFDDIFRKQVEVAMTRLYKCFHNFQRDLVVPDEKK